MICHILTEYFINQENIKVLMKGLISRKDGPYEETRPQK